MMRLTTPRESKICSMICTVLFLMIFIVTVAQSQHRIHNLGDFRYQHNAGEDYDNTGDDVVFGQWPQDVFRSGNFAFSSHERHVGSYVDTESGETVNKQGYSGTSWSGQEAPWTITEYRKYAPPDVYVKKDGLELASSFEYEGIVDPNIPSDIMIVNRFKAAPGFHGVSRSYSFANQNHNDYIIYETTYTFTGDHDFNDDDLEVTGGLTDVYFMLGYGMQTVAGTWISYSRWYEEGKDEWTSYESYTPQLTGGRDLVISYTWDGDFPELANFEDGDDGGPNGVFDDTGDPRWGIGSGGEGAMPSGEFVSAAYSGFALLYADDPNSIGTDDVTQPLSIISNIDLYAYWDNAFGSYGSVWDWAASGDREDVTYTDGWDDNDPSQLQGDYPFQSVGPYDFAVGDSIKIVHVLGSNGIDRSLSIQKGVEWRDWYRREAGATFDDDAKNDLLATGKDSLFQSFDRALWAWTNGMENVPTPLPSPNLWVRSGPNRVDLTWEMPDLNGRSDLDHFNIYRKKGSFLVDTEVELNADGTHLVWEHIATVPANVTTYSDSVGVIRGEDYHYGVTAVDNGTQNTTGLFPGQPLESSLYANRAELPANAFEPGLADADNVRIVPNPYLAGAENFNFTGERANTILFVNLPAYCTLRIYNATGDLIKKIDHSSGSADAEWNLVTETNQFVASGVYILLVSDAKSVDGESIGDAIEKFVVIR